MPPTSSLDTTSPLPNFAQITLPPGMTLPQFVSLQDSFVTAVIAAAVAFGVLICDYFHLFPHEAKLYHTASLHNPASLAFVLLRYSGILATLPALLLTSIQNKYCQAVVMTSQVGVVLVVASSGLIFGFRVSAMWGVRKAIYAIVGIMYVVMLGCWCAVVSQYRMETGPPAPFGSNCHMRPLVSWAPIAYASSVAFDMVVLLLATIKLTSNSPASSSTGHAISRDTLLYFLITTLANTAALVIQALGPRFHPTKASVTLISTVITATLGARVYLNHQLFSEREPLTEQVLSITLMADSRGIGVYPDPATPRHSSSGAATPQGSISKSYSVLDVSRPDTPFASYDDDSHAPKNKTCFPLPVFTRETVVSVE